jgi:hypothetical protein
LTHQLGGIGRKHFAWYVAERDTQLHFCDPDVEGRGRQNEAVGRVCPRRAEIEVDRELVDPAEHQCNLLRGGWIGGHDHLGDRMYLARDRADHLDI